MSQKKKKLSLKVLLFGKREGVREFGKSLVPKEESFQGSGGVFCEKSLFRSMTVGAGQS